MSTAASPALTGASETAAAGAEVGGDVGKRPVGEEGAQRGLNYERFGNLELTSEIPDVGRPD